GRGRINGGVYYINIATDRWHSAAPAIVNGKVVFTAHDSTHMHCVNLRDGQPLWKYKRQDDDLYFGGVFNGKALVVGKSYLRAINVESGPRETWGKELWRKDTGGLPSGQGAASGDIYYLPLQSTGDSEEKMPGIRALDLV